MEFRISSRKHDNLVLGAMFIPALVLVVTFILAPFIMTIILSITEGRGYSVDTFVGLDLYKKVFSDKTFLSIDLSRPQMKGALINSLLWMFVGVPLTMFIGFMVALFSDKKMGEGFLRSAFFLPMVVSGTVISIVWMYVYSPNQATGLLNAVFDTNISWLGDGSIVNYSLIFTWIWAQTGLAVVISSAALKGVPVDIIEASKIDGANPIQRLYMIIIPSIRPQMFMLMVTLLVSVLKVFDIVFVMTGGGPANKSVTMALLFYNQTFMFMKPHYGSAIITVMTVLVLIVYGLSNFWQSRMEKR